MSSAFDRGVENARRIIATKGVKAARGIFDAGNNGDEFDRGFESVLVDAEACAKAGRLQEGADEAEGDESIYTPNSLPSGKR